VTLLSPIKLWDPDKLEVLRRLDRHRQWHSLDEKRYCIACGNIITGREVQVVGGAPGKAELRLACPTENCRSIPIDWILPPDEVLLTTSMLQRQTSRPDDCETRSRASPKAIA
jgi:hypothetical protein